MIFKTYKTDLDGLSNTLGFSKRSFAEWGTQVKTAFQEGTTKVESFKNALSAMFTIQKEKSDTWIKNSTGDIVTSQNIDSYLPTIDDTTAKNTLQYLQSIQLQVDKGTVTWNDYFNTFKGTNQEYLIDFVQNTNLQIASTQDLVRANQQARESAIAHNVALKQQTLGAKAATVATKALAIAGNMIAMWAISQVISIVVENIDDLIHSAQNASEAMDELASESRSRLGELQDEADTLEDLISKYEELANAETYDSSTRSEIKDIQEQITELVGTQANNLDLVNGKLDEELEKLRKIASEEASETLDQAVTNYTNAVNSANAALADKTIGFSGINNVVVREVSDDATALYELLSQKYGAAQVQRLENFWGTETAGLIIDDDMFDGAAEKLAYLEEMAEYIKENYSDYSSSTVYSAIKSQISSYQKYLDAIETATQDLLEAGITDAYYNNEELNNITVDSAEAFQEYRDKIVEIISDSDDFKAAFSDGAVSIEDIQSAVDSYLATLSDFEDYYERIEDSTSNVSLSISDVFSLKDAEDNATALSKLSDQLSDITDAYETCLAAKEEYDEQGYLSVDTLQEVLALGDEYLQYLFDEEGNVRLDAEAFQQLAQARINDMEAQALQNLAENIKQITDEATATEYLAQKQNELASSYIDVAATALYAMSSIDGFSDSKVLQNAYNSFKSQYEQIKSLFATTRQGLSVTYSGKSSSSSSSTEKTLEDIQSEWKEYLEKYLDLYDAELDAGLTDFNTYLNKSRALLDEYYRDGKISAADYWDYVGDLYDKQLTIYDKVISAVTRRYETEIDRINDIIDGIEEQNDALESQLDNYDSILSVVDSVYEAEIDRIKAQQDAIDDTISRLQDENDERQLALDLEQAKYDLYKAQNQRTQRVYAGENLGVIYTTDKDTIRDAQENLDDLELEQTVAELEKEKTALDSVIEELEEYRDLWAGIADVKEDSENKQIAIDFWGLNYEDLILSNRISDVEDFKNKYVSIQDQINDNESLIASYEEKIEYYEDLKEQWSSIADAYENSMEDQYAAMILGQEWEVNVLNGRLDTLNTFRNEYISIQQALADAAWESANEQIRAAQEAQKAVEGSISNANQIGTQQEVTTISTSLDSTTTSSDDIPDAHKIFDDEEKNAYYSQTKIAWYKKNNSTKYASGTKNAKQGLNLVGENGTETYIDNDGNAALVTKPTLIPMEGGETVKNAMETKSLLDMSNLISIDSDEFRQKLMNYMPSFSSMVQIPNMQMPNFDYAVTRNETTPVVQNINLTLPNVTNDSGYERLCKEFKQMQLDALQYAHRR